MVVPAGAKPCPAYVREMLICPTRVQAIVLASDEMRSVGDVIQTQQKDIRDACFPHQQVCKDGVRNVP